MVDLVVLIPGFLGFEHFGGFPYFSQTVDTALRVALEDTCRDSPLQLQIVACSTIPAGSLAERQQFLLRSLTRCCEWAEQRSAGPLRLHLVGHSTGGLDAELLALRKPLGHEFWSEPADRIRRALRTIVSICAPLAGTNLADAAVVQLLATSEVQTIQDALNWPLQQLQRVGKLPSAIPEVWSELPDLLEGLPPLLRDDAVRRLIGGALYDPHPVLEFVNSLRTHRKLLSDLRPAQVQTLWDIGIDGRLDRIQRARYLTVARNKPDATSAGKLFEFFEHLTARHAADAKLDLVSAGLSERIARKQLPVIAANPALPPLRAATSDGIVNTLRQLPPCTPTTLDAELDHVAAVVVADHLDVLGYFPAETPFAAPAINGFLTSGSNFRAHEFSALYRSIAGQIAQSIR